MARSLLAGILLLLPIAVVFIVLARIFQLSRGVAAPVLARLPLETPNAWIVVDGTAAVILLLVCFLLGKLSQNKRLRERFGAIDNLLVDYFPRYTILKSFIHEDASGESQIDLPKPVAVTTEGVIQVGLEIERNDTFVVVYIPEAPSVWSGSYIVVPIETVQPLDISARDITRLSRNLGRGSLEILPTDLVDR